MNATRYDRAESVVVFYNATTGEKVTKFVKNLLHLCAQGEFCALVTRVDEEVAAAAVQQYLIILCNAIGSPVEIKCAQSSRLSRMYLSLTFARSGTCRSSLSSRA
jgi:hypothetical protein